MEAALIINTIQQASNTFSASNSDLNKKTSNTLELEVRHQEAISAIATCKSGGHLINPGL